MKRKQMCRSTRSLTSSGTGRMLLVLIFFMISSVLAFSQRVITGTVTGTDNLTLTGVAVIVKGTTIGATTDGSGKYSLTVPADAKTLVFSFVGMESKEISIGTGNVYNVTLSESLVGLEEVVVIGYGTQSREVLTTSVSKLDTKVLENIRYANIGSALQGSLSGVRVQSISGKPGDAPRIIIRGGTSINNPNGASPLYIVDGVIRSDLNDLNSDDIESLQVLKDAAATSIYGARGSNGVVIITTKTGKTGQMGVTYTANLTLSNQGKQYKMANARDYLTVMRLGIIGNAKFGDLMPMLRLANGYGTGNDLTNNTVATTQYLTPENEHKLSEGWESMPDPIDPSKTIIFKGTDYQDVLYQLGVSQTHNLSISGGSEKATYNAGIGYMDAQGTVITTKYNRLSFNLNGDIKVTDNFTFFSRVLFSKAKDNAPSQANANVFYRNPSIAPTTKYKFEDGTLAPGARSAFGNPEYYLKKFVRNSETERLTLTTGFNWIILPGLSFEPQVSLYNVNGDNYSFNPTYHEGITSINTQRSASGSATRWRQTQADALFNYSKSFFGSHNLGINAGISYFGRQSSSLSASGRDAVTDLIPTLNASGLAVSVNSSITDLLIFGYFGRLNYDYKQKYLFSANLRYDYASNLGEDHKWGFFPGVSLGWNMHNEEFWSVLPANLISLKLRGSYGVNGNISGLGDFTAQGAYGVGNKIGGQAAIQMTVIPNKDLKWEQSKTFDVGMDIGVFNRRLNLLIDYYRRVTDNLITTLNLPASTGFTSVLTNLSSLENKGFEFELIAQVLSESSSVKWDVSFNASKVKNKILKLPDNGIENNRIGGDLVWDAELGDYAWKGGLQEGGRMGDVYDRLQVRIYPTDEDALQGPVNTFAVTADKTSYGGDVEWYDADGNGLIDSRDRVYMGNIYPVWTGGFTNSISYKNFNLYTRLDYITGHLIYNWAKAWFDINGEGQNVMTQDVVDKSWKKQGDITDVPRYYWGGERFQRNSFDGTISRGTSRFQEKGDFLCVREVTLSYNLSADFIRKIKINNLKFNITGNNLHYFTKYSGLNPEEGGTDNGRWAMPRNIIFGLTASF